MQIHRYDGGHETHLRELVDERNDLAIASGEERVRLGIPLSARGGVVGQHWLAVVPQPLAKLRWSVEPFTRMG